MIHEAKVTFHTFEHFNFSRKQDANNYKLQQEHDLNVMIDRHYISFLIQQYNPLCKIKTKLIDFLLNKGQKSPNQLSIYFIPPAKKTIEINHVKLVTIKSSKATIQEIKEVIDKNRKYKSCLAFIPSKVKHISILSGEAPTQKFRGFINLAGIMFLILNLRNIIENFIRYGVQFGSTPTQFVPISFMIAMAIFLIFPILSYSIQKLQFKNIFSHTIAKLFLFLNMAGIICFNILYCLTFKPSPLLGVLHTSFAIIILLKLISYYQVNSQLYSLSRKLQKKPQTKSQKQIQLQMFVHYDISEENLREIQQNKQKSQNLIDFNKLMYFLAAPTLCYQLSYPKTSSIRYTWLGKRVVELFLMIGIIAILWFQYVQPELKQLLKAVHNPNTTWIQMFNRHLRLSIPNTMVWIAGFYAVFHLWLNITGQLLYFGDRNFYRDWWNCRSLEEYWKTWNLPVHFWFIRHVYNPILQSGESKLAANLIVFFISAVAHQYLVSVPLRFVSYWAFLAMMMQAPVIFIQKKVDKILRIENSQLSNVSFWVVFCIIGQPLVVFIYYSMYTDFINNSSQPKIPGFIPLKPPLQL